jgi:flagellar biosynthesis protein FlhG
MAKILTVTSGKGGVGKTNLSVNLAVHIAQQGFRTCLFDADLGLANINILLGLYPEHNLEDVIDGRKKLKDIVVHDKSGIDIIPGSSGVAKMESLTSTQLSNLTAAFGDLEYYDYLIFDTSAGISKNVIAFCMNASEVLLVITPEPTSLTDAYALMKTLAVNGFKKTTRVVVNQSKNPKTAQIAFRKLKDTVLKFLDIDLFPLGTIVSDERVIEAVTAQKPFITLFPNTQATKGLKTIADNLLDKIDSSTKAFTLDTFWEKCIDIFAAPIKMPPKKGVKTKEKQTPAPPPPSTPTSPIAQTAESVEVMNNSKTSLPGDETTRHLLEQLVEKVSTVSQELSGIRTALEQVLVGGFDSKGTGNRPEQIPTSIPLDFEAFLSEQESQDESP